LNADRAPQLKAIVQLQMREEQLGFENLLHRRLSVAVCFGG
jgi:hypothetical protein